MTRGTGLLIPFTKELVLSQPESMEKRKDRDGPSKLMYFFSPAAGRRIKDGAGSLSSALDAAEDEAWRQSNRSQVDLTGSGNLSTSNSPVKQRRKLTGDEGAELGQRQMAAELPGPVSYEDPLNSFPTSGQPILDTAVKEMLLSLRGSLQHDMAVFMKQTQRELDYVGERVDHVENKMGEFTQAHNELVKAHNDLEEEFKAHKLKVANLEDRSRRNNIKFHRITESVKATELRLFLQRMIADLLPSISPCDIIIDRAHRLPKPSYLPDKIPRDVIARIHFYHIKDQVMHVALQHPSLPDPYSGPSTLISSHHDGE